MIEFLYDRSQRLLLVHFGGELSSATLETLDALLAVFVAAEGTTDTIIDFSSVSGEIRIADIVHRARQPSRMPGRRRVFVASADAVFGLMRLYGPYQEERGEAPPHIVRSLEDAYAWLGVENADFEPATPEIRQ